jgi:hypothetical protein
VLLSLAIRLLVTTLANRYHLCVAPGRNFFLAVNYPWFTYGADFGRSPWDYTGVALRQVREVVAADFADIRNSGVSVVRWFLLCDGRSGIRYENGIPIGYDDLLFADVAAALDVALQSQLRICFSLFDFLWLQASEGTQRSADPNGIFPGRNALQFAGGREALLQRVLIPLFHEFRSHPALFAWEIVNEPEWAIPEFQRSAKAALPFADARTFFEEIALAIHQESGEIPATLGSARLQWVRAWSEIGLDLFQAHYYPQLELDANSLSQQLAEPANLPQPLWLGEVPANDPTTPSYSLEATLTACRRAGLAGAGVWRWRPPEPAGSDLTLGRVQPEILSAWLSQSEDFRV